MAINELISQVISRMTGDGSDELKALLKQAMAETTNFLDAHEATKTETETRRKKIRELEATANALKEEMEKIKANSPDVEQLKAKAANYDKLIADQLNAKKATWQKKAEILKVPENDKRHEKVKMVMDKFRSAPEGTELAESDIDFNLALMDTLEATGHFTIPADPKPGFGKPAPVNTGNHITSGQALFTNKLT